LKHLRVLYSVYPAVGFLPEYRLAKQVVTRYSCRSVLDVGCGRGNLLRVLEKAGARVDLYVGVDISPFSAPAAWNAQLVLCDARRLPVMTSRFDCVLFVNSVFYIGLDVLKALDPPRKVFAVIDVDPRRPHIRLVDLVESRLRGMRITKEGLLKWLSENNFSVVEHGGATTYYVVFSS